MPECNKTTPAIEECHPTPEWLTKDYLQQALRSHHRDKTLAVKKMVVTPATAKGENYASVMTRVQIEYTAKGGSESNDGSYIVKTSFEGDEFAAEKLKDYDIYKREMDIYQKIIPNLDSFLREIDDKDQLFASTVAVDYEHSAIIFEDLSRRSYVMADRSNGLDMAHIKIVLSKLAKMHATTAVLNDRQPGTFEHYDRGFFNHYTDAFTPLFVDTLDACARLVSKWDDFKSYGKKLSKLKSVLMEYGRRVFDAKDNHFNALAHGDLWTNNVMFKYNERNEPTDAVLIDFQYSAWGSPAIDLHYLFNTSLREEMRLHQQEELVKYYYDILADTLRALKFSGHIPSLHEFWIQCIEKSFYAFTSTCLVQPIMLNEETEDADFHSLLDVDDRAKRFKDTIFKNEKVQKNLKKLLPIFDRRGLLDLQE